MDYDFFEGAVDITASINSCSADEAYTTVGGTSDRNAGSCWNNSGPRYNRWFTFQASAPQINITVDINGTKGTQRRTQLALWESDGSTELACDIYNFDSEDVSIGYTSLTPGNWYYLSVDAYNNAYDGTFTLCLDDAVDYDFFEGAFEISDINNWCSSDEQFSTIGGTPDLNAGACWNNSGPRYNRWFTFQATTAQINAVVDINGTKGTQRRTQLALWESDGSTELACDIYNFDNEDVSIGYTSLTPGNWYYISVDAYNNAYDGSFTLCVDNTVNYDFLEGAFEITNLDNWCSADSEFSTLGGTSDQNAGSCWNNSGPRYNRWFTFNAISSNATIVVDIGGSKGTQRRTQLALWESDGTTQIDCQRYSFDAEDVTITNSSLTPGNTYYISVDVYNSSYDGSFTLCVDNVDQTYYSIASGAWDNGNNWSLGSHAGPAAGTYPTIGDIANIEGHTVTTTTTETVGGININAATNNTGLTISNGAMDITGQLNITNPGNNFNITVTVSNSTLLINDNLVVNRNGGSAIISSTISNSTVNINRDFTINSTAGTGDNTFGISTLSNFSVGGELTLSNSGGPKSTITVDNSDLTIDDNLNFTATTDNRVELRLSTASDLHLGNNVVRGTPAYGILNSTGNSTVHYSSASNLQLLASTDGSGTGDVITYENVVINNSRITTPQVTTEGPVSITGTLTLTDGLISSSTSNLLTLEDGASISGGSAASFVRGPLMKVGVNSPFTFHIGNGNKWAPLSLSYNTGDAATEFTAEYTASPYFDTGNVKSPDPNGDMTHVSSAEYWTLENTGTAADVDITLHWKDQAYSGIQNFADLVIAHYDIGNTEWENLGQASIVGSDPGSITVSGVTNFSPFTFGSTSLDNPLPIHLVSFEAKVESDKTLLTWATASELNNDQFEIERSANGQKFEKIGTVKGAGNSTELNTYHFQDIDPISGSSYYRLKQIDFDGSSQYSEIVSVYHDFSEYTLYPNPVTNGSLNVKLKVGSTGFVNIAMTNAIGQNVAALREQYTPGVFEVIPLDVKSLPAGLYTIKIDVDNSSVVERILIR